LAYKLKISTSSDFMASNTESFVQKVLFRVAQVHVYQVYFPFQTSTHPTMMSARKKEIAYEAHTFGVDGSGYYGGHDGV
jgi:hypothetical protein